MPSGQKIKSRKDEAWVGALEERIYAHVPIFQPSTINHQHSPSLQDGGNLHRHENFEECPQTLTGNSHSQTKQATPLGALPASPPKYDIQLWRDIHEMSSNVAHP